MNRPININFIILTLLFSMASAQAFWKTSTCQQLDWVKEESRTQGGGWIWYPGRARDSSKESAMIRAEGSAIRALIQECQVPHVEAKIHERCSEELGGIHHAYVRVSLRDLECEQARRSSNEYKTKITNQQMNTTYQKYLKLEGMIEENATGCNNIKECYDRGTYAAFRDETQKALDFFRKGCDMADDKCCFNAGLIAMEQNDYQAAEKFFNLQCKRGDLQSCHFKALTLASGEKERGLENNCNAGFAHSCLEHGLGLLKPQPFAAIVFLDQACQKGDAQICHQVSTHYYDHGLAANSAKSAQVACQKGFGKACFNLFQMESKASTKEKLSWLTTACVQKVAPACRAKAELSSNQTEKNSLWSQGCDAGDANSCQALASSYYDRKDILASLKYSKFACKLGLSKSCHNSGMLEEQRGNRQEAKLFLETSCQQGIQESCQAMTQIN